MLIMVFFLFSFKPCKQCENGCIPLVHAFAISRLNIASGTSALTLDP
jgi:hypothetical protein